MFLRFTYLKNRRSQIIVGHMPSAILKITITSLSVIMNTIQSVIGSVNCSAEERDEMEYEISQSIQSIEAWKAYLLRAINQNATRHEDMKFWKILVHRQC